MISRSISSLTLVLAACGLSLACALTGCAPGPAQDAAAEKDTATQSKEAEQKQAEPKAPEPVETEETDSDVTPAGWSKPINTDGDIVATYENDSVRVDVHATAFGEAPEDEGIEHPDTGESLVPAGSPVVVLNAVITNITDETLPIGESALRLSIGNEGWPFMSLHEVESAVDWRDSLGAFYSSIDWNSDSDITTLEAGHSFSNARVVPYLETSYEVEVTLTPETDDGLDHDNPVLAESQTFTITRP
ncbi:hypothetical protein PQI23_08300 [Leucobacter sp. USCH14]|uniref:hypothetical protein n=1 Tax=Leucobacter sp. USCH14 TaxID=3024838 RepID=UPI00309E9FA2